MGKKALSKKQRKQQFKIRLLTDTLAKFNSLLKDFDYHYDSALNQVSDALNGQKNEENKRRILDKARYSIAGHHMDVFETLYRAAEYLKQEDDSKTIQGAAKKIESSAVDSDEIEKRINKKRKIAEYMDEKLNLGEVRKARNIAGHMDAYFTGIKILMMRDYTRKMLEKVSVEIRHILRKKLGVKDVSVQSFIELRKITEAQDKLNKTIESKFRDFLTDQVKRSDTKEKDQ